METNKLDIKDILKKVKDYNLYHSEEEDDFEEFDNIYELYYELTIQLFDELSDIEDLKSTEYINSLDDFYIKNKKGEKIFLKEFIKYIYLDEDKEEWNFYGDEYYREMLGI